MASYIFSDLLAKAPASIKSNAADARTWLSSNMRQGRQSRILQGDRSRLEDHISIGGILDLCIALCRMMMMTGLYV